MENISEIIARELSIKSHQVIATKALLEDGATVPFIARYRKEATGLLDDIQITAVRDRLAQLAELAKRRESILSSLSERDLLNGELKQKIQSASCLAILEDIYLPYRPKRRTRSIIAKEKGLEPLAHAIFTQDNRQVQASKFIDFEKEVSTEDDALAGARDIIAEWINEDQVTRVGLRRLFNEKAIISSAVVKKNKESGIKFQDYFDWQEHAGKTPSHRFLAMLRGEHEKVLNISMKPPEADALLYIHRRHVKNNSFSGQQVSLAVDDCYKRLLGPSLENELRSNLKEKADQEAIRVFAANLKELLLAPPLGQKNVMALDPGFRTGAKLVCIDSQGKLLHFCAIYPTHSGRLKKEAEETVLSLCGKYTIEAIAIGNGTAGRETEEFVRSLNIPGNPIITMVDESGASIYSASNAARAEFPDHDVTVRGAVSIGRRLQDPLAELVKLDPKAIGVGQYQHDVDQLALKKSLDDVVIGCVNNVGVELNTASVELLTFVSGLGSVLAKNIVLYRDQNGPFENRKSLLKVPRLGAKAYEQCSGFLRIHGAVNPLDSSAVHPEQYNTVEKMAKDLGCNVRDLIEQETVREKIDLSRYVNAQVGLPTLNDIFQELSKPGRDPRDNFSAFAFDDTVNCIEDLKEGMRLPGLVTNVTKFGAFVDIGVHQDGLIHISQLANRFVKDPTDVVKVRQQVMVRVVSVDFPRKRIALSLRDE